jgi:hypothetical protein
MGVQDWLVRPAQAVFAQALEAGLRAAALLALETGEPGLPAAVATAAVTEEQRVLAALAVMQSAPPAAEKVPVTRHGLLTLIR